MEKTAQFIVLAPVIVGIGIAIRIIVRSLMIAEAADEISAAVEDKPNG